MSGVCLQSPNELRLRRLHGQALPDKRYLAASRPLTPDINKIVRGGDYADPHLAQLSVDAVKMWQRPEWEGCYHE